MIIEFSVPMGESNIAEEYQLHFLKICYFQVNWNKLGQPIGKESVTLAHYVGALARRTFPITINDFRKKELTQAKEGFWDEIMV